MLLGTVSARASCSRGAARREGLLGPAPQSPVFVPVQTLAPASTAMAPLDHEPRSTPTPVAASRSSSAPGTIEIELGSGRRVRVGRDVNLAALRRVLAALRE